MTFTAALAIAVTFWGARHVNVPSGLREQSKPDSFMPVVNGDEAIMAYANGVIYVSPAGRFYQHDAPAGYCAAIVHETGHAAGLAHTTTGIMSVPLNVYDNSTLPWACRVAARVDKVS